MARIVPLPEEVVAQIKSTTVITSIEDVVCGLVKNALDAQATRIEISVDFRLGGCVVEDNGDGIAPAEFVEPGGLGKMHFSSKLGSQAQVHGKNGAFLAGLAAISLLTISSRHVQHRSQNSLSFHHGGVVSRLLPAPQEHQLRSSQGTRVLVRDLFGNIPVRVKQRDLRFQNAHNIERDWDSLKRSVLVILVFWPTAVEAFICCENDGKQIRLRGNDTKSTENDLSRSILMLNQAGVTVFDAESWTRVAASVGDLHLIGAISNIAVSTRHVQFFAFGIHPLSLEQSRVLFLDELNKEFSRSLFGNGQRDAEKGRSVDRWPQLILRVELMSHGKVDVDGLEDQFLKAVQSLVQAVSREFLTKHGYIVGTKQRTPIKNISQQRSPEISPSKIRRRLSLNKHNELGAGIDFPTSMNGPREDLNWRALTRARFSDDSLYESEAQRMSHKEPSSQRRLEPLTSPVANTSPGTATWSDPRTKAIVTIERRTGCVQPTNILESPVDTSYPSPVWLDSFLANWTNPTFQSSEAPIPCHDPEITNGSSSSTDKTNIRLSRKALLEATVIAQVDNKFILIKSLQETSPSSQGEEVLILVDQHAADERVKLEELLRGFLTPERTIAIQTLPSPLRVSLRVHEIAAVRREEAYLTRWGIQHTLLADSIEITALPPAIAQRCVQEPDMLRRGLLSTLSARQDSSSTVTVPAPDESQSEVEWLRHLHDMPAFILELLNSRACRSAIMFNDELDQNQCRDLISALAGCAFPFQCAHGRPSMVPLLLLPAALDESSLNP
jgi:DNA mismatch repair protein MLH3